MAVIKIRPADAGFGGSVPIGHGPEDAAQTWERGSVLIADENTGEILEAADEPTDLIMGIAVADASAVTSNDVTYYKAIPGVRFIASVGTSLTAGDIAAADLFEEFPLQLDTNEWYVDISDNSNPAVRIVEFIDPVGTTNGTVIFEFLTDTLLMAN